MEPRKGWKILLQAFWTEFSPRENVRLYLHTYLVGSSKSRDANMILKMIKDYSKSLNLEWDLLPPVVVITDELPIREMPRLYKAADAFVLSSHGEGWGLPIMEAMAMGLPAIATNWSGNVDFMTPDNSFLIEVEEMIPAQLNQNNIRLTDTTGHPGSFDKWAKPSVSHLKQLLRQVFSDREHAKSVGKKARAHIVKHFSQERVGQLLIDRLSKILLTLDLKRT